jgi:hypothetical protein
MSGIIGDNTGTGSGQIAAVQGVTKSSSDPAIDTNPSGGVGTIWANTTSGEMYACKDDTAGANVWVNVGGGTGDIEPYSFGGTNDGYTHCGAHAPYMDHVDKFAFASGTQDAVDHGDDTSGRAYVGGNRSATHGYISGGLTTTVSKIQYASDATHDAAPATGTLSWSDRFTCNPGCSSPTHGYVGGWESHTTSIEKITFATDAVDARATGLVTAAAYASGSTSEDYGYVAGANSGSDVIQRYALAAETVSTDVGNIASSTKASYYRSGASSADYGYSMGGDSPEINVIERYSFASGSEDAENVGDLAVAKGWGMSQSSKTYGYFSGGDYSPQTDDIEKFAFASSTTDTEASGSLTVARMGGVGTEN